MSENRIPLRSDDVLVEDITARLKDAEDFTMISPRVVAKELVEIVRSEFAARGADYFQFEDISEPYKNGRCFDDLGNGVSAAYGLMDRIWAQGNLGKCTESLTVVRTTPYGDKSGYLEVVCTKDKHDKEEPHEAPGFRWHTN